jgi:hypothetical protein
MNALHAGLVAALLGAATPLFSQSSVTILTAPEQPLIERRDGQALNFDFVIENGSADTLELVGIELTVKDHANAIVLRRFLDNNGFSPSILTVPQRKWAPGDKRLVFNPFHAFPATHDLALLEYAFRFRRGNSDVVHAVAVRPQPFSNKTDLILPLGGRLLVWDGHDFYSHHRRFDFTHPAAQQFGFRRNFMRYAYDFVRVDSAGAMQREGSGNERYLGFGAVVVAPGSGVVTAIGNEQPDNRDGEDFFDPMKLVENPMGLYGNHVVIDHGNGEFSLLGHLRAGSVVVKVGDRVAQGTPLAQIGSSGSSYFPHLHYELRTGSTLMVEGLPSYFRSFERIVGNRTAPGSDAIDTGDLVRTTIRGGSK